MGDTTDSRSFLKKYVDAIVNSLEDGFERYGKIVGRNPFKVILIAVIFALLSTVGFLRFNEENRGEKLWVDQNSDYIHDQEKIRDWFPVKVRQIKVMFENDINVLTPLTIQNLYKLHLLVINLYNGSSNEKLHWKNIAFGQPTSLLELWSFNTEKIYNLTQEDITLAINQQEIVSGVSGRSIDINEYIAGIEKNSSNHITSASIVKSTYFIQKNDVFDDSKGAWVDDIGKTWELEFAKVLKATVFHEVTVYYSTWESYVQAGLDAVGNDFGLFFSGYGLIITYVALMLGKFSRIQHKVWLAVSGVLCVVLAIGVSYGLCSAVGIIFGPVHSVLPFLLLGIGVDDIFVIIQSWDNIDHKIQDNEQIAIKISKTLRHAGVAITVTSITDVFAFLIGASTVLPALRSFCIYAAVGIAMLYLFAISFFVAFLTLDARRQNKRRDACFCVKLGENWRPLACSNKMYFQKNMQFLSGIFFSTVGKAIIIMMTLVMVGFGSYGVSQMKQDSDPNWFLPPESDEAIYWRKETEMFSGFGEKTSAYIGSIPYFENQEKLSEVYDSVVSNNYIVNTTVVSWYKEYIKWLEKNISYSNQTQNGIVTNKETFSQSFLEFIENDGEIYKNDIKYSNNGNQIIIHASRFRMTHILLKGSEMELKAMDDVRDAVSKITFTDGTSPIVFTEIYINWETNRIIGKEILRNLILAAVCVFLVILFLIVNFITSLMVLFCVAFSIIDMCGFMYYWGVTIDFIVSTVLVLAIGFAVDYAAHIGHAFMACRHGDRKKRSQTAFVEIGPAVFNGGFSTFLAFVLLAFSESYAFKLFFKVFFLVVSLGLFHGLLFLPAILSLIGPKPYGVSAKRKETSDNSTVISNTFINVPPDQASQSKPVSNNNTLSLVSNNVEHAHIENLEQPQTENVDDTHTESIENADIKSVEHEDTESVEDAATNDVGHIQTESVLVADVKEMNDESMTSQA